MGLNDLTLEKLIGEINGYKQKMQTLYEDYGHAAQELQNCSSGLVNGPDTAGESEFSRL